MPEFEGIIKFRFVASSSLVADLYVDGLCTAMRYNKPEIDAASVEWQIQPVQDELRPTQFLDPPDIETPSGPRQAGLKHHPKELPPGKD